MEQNLRLQIEDHEERYVLGTSLGDQEESEEVVKAAG